MELYILVHLRVERISMQVWKISKRYLKSVIAECNLLFVREIQEVLIQPIYHRLFQISAEHPRICIRIPRPKTVLEIFHNPMIHIFFLRLLYISLIRLGKQHRVWIIIYDSAQLHVFWKNQISMSIQKISQNFASFSNEKMAGFSSPSNTECENMRKISSSRKLQK